MLWNDPIIEKFKVHEKYMLRESKIVLKKLNNENHAQLLKYLIRSFSCVYLVQMVVCAHILI